MYRKGKLPADRVEILENLDGWTWSPFDDEWQEFVRRLHEHFGATGTTRVKAKYKTPDGYKLGDRISRWRGYYKKGKLSADRIAILESIGDWIWDARN